MHLGKDTVLQGGKYRIEKMLGQGGFGITYLAFQPGLNRKVAIKEFFMKDLCNRDPEGSNITVPSIGSRELVERFKAKFLKEASTIAGMDSVHIVRIHDIFEENGTAYYVMEYLGEESLQSRIPMAGMDLDKAVDYVRQIAQALSYIHSQSILHLDIKPSNILFRHGTEVVLIDFGISKHYDCTDGGQTSSTPVGLSRGYAPLEQNMAGGVSQFTPATDIYSLGATFYKLLTGKTPPSAEEVNEDGLPAFDRSLPSGVVSVIEKSMRPRRKERPQTVGEFMELLDKACADRQKGDVKPQKPEPPLSPVQDDKTVIGSGSSFQEIDNPLPQKKKSRFSINLLSVISIGILIGLIYIISDIFSLGKDNSDRAKYHQEVVCIEEATDEVVYPEETDVDYDAWDYAVDVETVDYEAWDCADSAVVVTEW